MLSKSILISVFYRLFFLVIVIIIGLNNRKNVTTTEINEMMLILITGLIILIIASVVLSYQTNSQPTTCFEYTCNKILFCIKYIYNAKFN